MTFDSPELEKLRKAWKDSGRDISMRAVLQTPQGLVELDLVKILLELAQRDDANYAFMDPPRHHTGTPVARVAVSAEDNPTGRDARGGPRSAVSQLSSRCAAHQEG